VSSNHESFYISRESITRVWVSVCVCVCKKLSGEVLEWLSVWSKLQMICIWSSWYYCRPIISCFIKIQIDLSKYLYICIALYHDSSLKRSGMAHVNEGSHSFTCHPSHTFIHKWNEPYLPLLPSRRASPHFGWYSFPVPLTVGGWVGLGGLVKYWGGLPAEDGHPSQY